RHDRGRAVNGLPGSAHPHDLPVAPHDIVDLGPQDSPAARFDMPRQRLDVARGVGDAPVPAKPDGEIQAGMEERIMPAKRRAVEFFPAKTMLPADGPGESVGLEAGALAIGVKIVAWAHERLRAGALG